MKLKHEVREEERLIEKTDHWSGEIEGYDVIFEHNDLHGAKLSIYPIGQRDRIRLGVIECRPDNVDSLDRFAEDAPRLFTAIAAELRELGKDDLRDRFDIERDEFDAKVKATLAAAVEGR